MRAISLILATGALLLAACGGPATATNNGPAPSVATSVATEAPPSATLAQTPKSEPVATASPTQATAAKSLADAQRLAEGIAREGMAYALAHAEPEKKGNRPTLESVWLEGSALIWQGETVIWINANSAQIQRHTFMDGFNATLGDFLTAGLDEAMYLLYERRDTADFDKVYVSYTFQGVPATSHDWFLKEDLASPDGTRNKNVLFDAFMKNGTDTPVPWIASAK